MPNNLPVEARRIDAEKESSARDGETCCEMRSSLREERRGQSERVHQLELETRELRQQLPALSQRIEEEYQLKLADVIASGASAVKIYLNELRCRFSKKGNRHD